VPAEKGLRFHEEDGVSPVVETTRDRDEHASFPRAERRALHLARSDDELLAEGCVFGEKLVARAEEISNEAGYDRNWTERLPGPPSRPRPGRAGWRIELGGEHR